MKVYGHRHAFQSHEKRDTLKKIRLKSTVQESGTLSDGKEMCLSVRRSSRIKYFMSKVILLAEGILL